MGTQFKNFAVIWTEPPSATGSSDSCRRHVSPPFVNQKTKKEELKGEEIPTEREEIQPNDSKEKRAELRAN